jgi:hypothetical protein
MKINPFIILSFLFFGGWNTVVFSQFNTIPGKPQSIAIHGDSSCFVNWASEGIAFPGLRQINVPDSGMASVGTINSAFGKHRKNGVISLGDGGSVVLGFPQPIINGPGFDFAVFENAFNDSFLELAHVEVSQDGQRYFRFPSLSYSQTGEQTQPFGTTYPDSIHNLAGRFRMPYGTPFDLNDFKDTPDFPTTINYVKIIDVVGSIDSRWGSKDSRGNLINDPWPTNFGSSGFDLDAVGVINQLPINSSSGWLNQSVVSFSNPQNAYESFIINLGSSSYRSPGSKSIFDNTKYLFIEIYDAAGIQVYSTKTAIREQIELKPNLKPGLYFVTLNSVINSDMSIEMNKNQDYSKNARSSTNYGITINDTNPTSTYRFKILFQ